jgi:hypothetical protein
VYLPSHPDSNPALHNLERGCVILHFIKKVGISFEVPLSDNLVDLLAIFLVVFVVCYILSKFYSCNLIKFL